MYRLEVKRNRVRLKKDSLITIKQDIFVTEIYHFLDIADHPGIIMEFSGGNHKKLSL